MIEDPYTFVKRSIIVDKKSTTISMERVYWYLLVELARRQRTPWRYFVRSILRCRPSGYKSRAGWLRMYIAGYAYTFLRRPAGMVNRPKTAMEWDPARKEFRFPTKTRYVWED